MPTRTCIVCRRKKEKRLLFRFVVKDGEVCSDILAISLGRGFYICMESGCLASLEVRKILAKRCRRVFEKLKDRWCCNDLLEILCREFSGFDIEGRVLVSKKYTAAYELLAAAEEANEVVKEVKPRKVKIL